MNRDWDCCGNVCFRKPLQVGSGEERVSSIFASSIVQSTVAKITANYFLQYLRFLCVGSPSFLVISALLNNELSVDVIVSVVALARRFCVAC